MWENGEVGCPPSAEPPPYFVVITEFLSSSRMTATFFVGMGGTRI